jgi:tRNA (mo5U34)-methyltransferase
MSISLPSGPDDPLLDGWYHTIELGRGLVSRGTFDHRGVINQYGIPASLHGKTALDVGTCDGFFAFELERRGADNVVAIDVDRIADLDWLPQRSARLAKARSADAFPSEWRTKISSANEFPWRTHFEIARELRGSKVERKVCSVYDLSPERVGGMFDVVFCGSLLLHLKNPLQALLNIRSVTRGMAIIETMLDEELERTFPNQPLVRFGVRAMENVQGGEIGERCTYWSLTTQALEDMMIYAGFSSVQPQAKFWLPVVAAPPGVPCVCLVGFTDA